MLLYASLKFDINNNNNVAVKTIEFLPDHYALAVGNWGQVHSIELWKFCSHVHVLLILAASLVSTILLVVSQSNLSKKLHFPHYKTRGHDLKYVNQSKVLGLLPCWWSESKKNCRIFINHPHFLWKSSNVGFFFFLCIPSSYNFEKFWLH